MYASTSTLREREREGVKRGRNETRMSILTLFSRTKWNFVRITTIADSKRADCIQKLFLMMYVSLIRCYTRIVLLISILIQSLNSHARREKNSAGIYAQLSIVNPRTLFQPLVGGNIHIVADGWLGCISKKRAERIVGKESRKMRLESSS